MFSLSPGLPLVHPFLAPFLPLLAPLLPSVSPNLLLEKVQGRKKKHNSLSSFLFTCSPPILSPLSHQRKELLVKPHTFWKVICLVQEEVNNIWMMIDKLHTLKLAARERKRRGKDGCKRKPDSKMCMSLHELLLKAVPLQQE